MFPLDNVSGVRGASVEAVLARILEDEGCCLRPFLGGVRLGASLQRLSVTDCDIYIINARGLQQSRTYSPRRTSKLSSYITFNQSVFQRCLFSKVVRSKFDASVERGSNTR